MAHPAQLSWLDNHLKCSLRGLKSVRHNTKSNSMPRPNVLPNIFLVANQTSRMNPSILLPSGSLSDVSMCLMLQQLKPHRHNQLHLKTPTYPQPSLHMLMLWICIYISQLTLVITSPALPSWNLASCPFNLNDVQWNPIINNSTINFRKFSQVLSRNPKKSRQCRLRFPDLPTWYNKSIMLSHPMWPPFSHDPPLHPLRSSMTSPPFTQRICLIWHQHHLHTRKSTAATNDWGFISCVWYKLAPRIVWHGHTHQVRAVLMFLHMEPLASQA